MQAKNMGNSADMHQSVTDRTTQLRLTLILVSASILLSTWLSFQISSIMARHKIIHISILYSPLIFLRLGTNLSHPFKALPFKLSNPPSSSLFWILFTVTLAFLILTTLFLTSNEFWSTLSLRIDRGNDPRPAHWAKTSNITTLFVNTQVPGRLIIGKYKNHLVASESSHSVLIIGPTQSFKTSGFAIPSILEWKGPIIATSVKGDLVNTTFKYRSSQGPVFIVDPTESSGKPSNYWDPLKHSLTWPGAKKTATKLAECAQTVNSGIEDAGFWYQTASKLIAPLLFAAANSSLGLRSIIKWVDTQEIFEPMDLLRNIGLSDALNSFEASIKREERQKSSVYTTAETMLSAYEPRLDETPIDIESLIYDSGTLYITAPAFEQRRLTPYFSAMISTILDYVYLNVAKTNHPLNEPLLLLLDEAANIAPLKELDSIASTAASHGIQLVTVWQDLAQLNARYGQSSATVLNNHKMKVLLSGSSDLATLDSLSNLIGTSTFSTTSVSSGKTTQKSVTRSNEHRPLAPSHLLRQIPPGEGVVLNGHLPPFKIKLRPWFNDTSLKSLVERD